MSNDEAAALLKEKGYDAGISDGSVVVVSDDQKDFEKIGRVLKKAGYKASYGWKRRNAVSIGTNGGI